MSASSCKALIAGLLALAGTPAIAAPALPRIDFVYPAPDGPIFDRICPGWMKRTVARADVDEALARKSEFEQAWQGRGLDYVRMVLEATERPFPYEEMQATLSVCMPDSMAMPLTISLGEILSSNDKPFAHDIPLLVFHEIMHHYAQAIEAESPLLAKYAAEPRDIRHHLHVVALEQYVLKTSGNQALYRRLGDYYAALPRPSYKRAWDIAEKETPEAFLADIRKAAPAPARPTMPPGIPRVTMVYPAPDGAIFDVVCPHWTDTKVDPAAIKQAVAMRPAFQAEWDKDGPVLLRTMFEATGRAFPYQEMQATLTLCASPMAMPLFINVKRHLPGNIEPVGHSFPLLVFHEMMHHYSLPIEAASALRQQYASEPLDVLNHLHVVAMEQYVLTALGRTAERDTLRTYYFNNARPPYKRAWEIVEAETPAPFIAELRGAAQRSDVE